MKNTIAEDKLKLGNIELGSRVLLGSAMYASRELFWECVEQTGTEMVTVSLRRISPQSSVGNLYQELRSRGIHVLPNTAGCMTSKEAIQTAELAREALETSFIKLEVIADEDTLLPEPEALLFAARELCKYGFSVMAYTNDDPILGMKLQDAGCVAVMPLASPIGSGRGIRNPHNLELMRQKITVPLIIDAGIGTASDVTLAFELGADAVLLNTAVAKALNPLQMALAVRHAALAGRAAYGAGRIPKKDHAVSSSPMFGMPYRKP